MIVYTVSSQVNGGLNPPNAVFRSKTKAMRHAVDKVLSGHVPDINQKKAIAVLNQHGWVAIGVKLTDRKPRTEVVARVDALEIE